MLSDDYRRQLQRYVDGEISNAELDEWLTSLEYDDEASDADRETLAGIRLVLIEVQEERRNPDEVLASVLAVLAPLEHGAIIVVPRSGSTTTWAEQPTLDASPVQPQRVGI